MSKPLIQVVDEQDRPIRAAEKEEIWEKGLWHRVARIMLEDDKGRVLLQHRVASKKLYPNCWDNSAAGHVDIGEDYQTAALRELEEEVGIKDHKLELIGSHSENHVWHGLKINRFVRVYKTKIDEVPSKLAADEVDEVRWFTVDEAKKFIKDHPDEITDGLEIVLRRYY